MNVQRRIERIRFLESQIRSHPMCRHFIVEPMHFSVLYPAGFQFDGARSEKAGNKAEALERLLKIMERHWLESFPNAKAPPND